MRRAAGLFPMALACCLAAPKPDARVGKAVRAVERWAAAEPVGLASDTRIRAAELLKQSYPELARKLALEAAAQLKDSRESDNNVLRITHVLVAIDSAGAERLTASLPNQGLVRDALLNYWVRKEDWPRAIAIFRSQPPARRLISVSRLLGSLKDKDPEGAAALFRQVLAEFPEKPSANEAMSLMQAMGAMYKNDPADVVKAAQRLLELAAPEDFLSSSPDEIVAEFKIGEKTIKAKDSRESVLIPLSISLAVLDKAAFQEHEKLFAGWAGDLAALPPEKLIQAAQPVRMTMRRRQSGKAEAKLEPPDYSKLPFNEALAKIRSAPERAQPLVTLLRRDKLTAAEQDRAAHALLEELPRMPAQSRLGPARELLDICVDHGLSRWTRPAIDAVLSAASVSPKPGAYAEVAAALDEEHIRLRVKSPPLAAQQALIRLREALERGYDFKLAALDGRSYQLRRARGKVVFLTFWASW